MRKIFLFFAAMMVAVAVNATTTTVHNTNFKNNLKTAVAAATAGDVLELEDGIYYEEGNFDMKKNLTIKAASGAHPVIANLYYFRVEGANVTFQGIEFDGAIYKNSADATVTGASDHCVRSYKNGDGNEDLVFEDCEFHGYKSYVLYTYAEARKWHSLTVRNCYFHDNVKHGIAINHEASGGNSCDALVVENSTFANTSGDYRAILIQSGNTTTLSVNHCTFYNYSGHFIELGSDVATATISNSIFANPSAKSAAAISASAGAVTNCLAYNTGAYTGVTTDATDITGDPLFVNAAEGNLTLGEGSPALGAGTESSNLGDPRWWPAAPATPNFYIAGIGGWNPDQVAVTGSSYTFENLAAGDYQFKITRNGTWSGENNVYGYDALTAKIGGLYRWNGGESDNNIMFTLADAGDVTVTYIEGEKFTVEGDFTIWPVELAGSWDSEWKDKRTFVPAADKMTASVTLNFTNDYYEFKLIDNGTWKGKWINNNDDKYYLTRSVLSVNNLEEGKNNIVITPDVAGDYKFTWTYGTGELTVEYPALPNPVYYLAGSMFTDGDWSQALVAMTETDGVWSKTVNFESTDSKELKVVRSVEGIHVISQDWLGLAEAQTITATTSDLVIGTGDANIGITPSKAGAYVFAFDPDGNKLSVTYPTTTALDNTVVADKAQKFMENGQLFIRRDGKIYTTTGVQVK